jgi:membrane protease subunit HflC
MSRKAIGALIVVLALAIVGSQATYTVAENEQAIITQFGEIQGGAVTDPGLHFKTPFVQAVTRFDKRWLEWDGSPNQIPTRDKKYIWVDTYARGRISDPVLFFKRLRDEMGAQSRLDDIIDGEFRNAIANHNLIEIVRTSSRPFEAGDEADETHSDDTEILSVKLGRDALTKVVLDKASTVMPDYGIELADVQIKRVGYVESVQVKVFERMVSERMRIAERYRSEGQGRSAEIRGRIERELKAIESEAFRKAEEVRGKADAQAAAIYAAAYGKDPELYQFVKSLETYRKSIDKNTTILLSTDSELLRYLKSER